MIVGDDWWLERHEYHGGENWVFITKPEKPAIEKPIKRLAILEGDPEIGWKSLAVLNKHVSL